MFIQEFIMTNGGAKGLNKALTFDLYIALWQGLE